MPGGIHKIGIIGTGMVARFHALAFEAMDNAEVIGVYDLDADRAETFASEYKCEPFDTLDGLLSLDGLEAVTVCTPSGSHMEPAMAAAGAGKHVIVEKPLEVTLKKIDRMIEACDRNGVRLVGILPRRFNDSTRLLKEAIDGGRLGKLMMADAYVKWYRSQEYYDSGDWRGTWALDGGGALMNQSIHTIDLLVHLAGDVKSVCAAGGCEAHENIEVEDIAVAIVEFVNGARGVIEGSTACFSNVGHPAEVQICGTDGSVFMVDDKFRVWDFRDSRPEDEEIVARYGINASGDPGAGAADPGAIDFRWHQRNFEEALAAIEEDRNSVVDGVESRRVVEVITAVYESIRAGGKKIELQEK